MRIEGNRIYVRQSWLGDALLCPERARLGAKYPEDRRNNDSAVMGTSVHHGIEAVLNGAIESSDIGSYSVEKFREMESEYKELGTPINITNTDPANWSSHIDAMAKAWVRDIAPQVPLGGLTEYPFAVQVGQISNAKYEFELWFEGTMDYMHQSGIWDWKTAARKFNFNEKQNQNVQSSVYAASAVALGALNYDVSFSFGVMVRNAKSAGQVLTISRTEGHGQWIVEQAISMVNTVLLLQDGLPAERWPINDQHYLCSERWCPAWSKCKGSFIKTVGDDNSEEG